MKLKDLIEVDRRRIQPKYVDKRRQMAGKIVVEKLSQQIIDGDILVDMSLIPEGFKSNVKHIRGNLRITNASNLQLFQKLYMVDGLFHCSGNRKLKSLKGGPVEVGLSYFCYNCDLRSLQGVAQSIGITFDCAINENLESLKYGPEYVGLNYYCDICGLTSLQGAPQVVGGKFECSNNKNLTSLQGGPKQVEQSYICQNCSITSLDGAPYIVGKDFKIEDNPGNFTQQQIREVSRVMGNVIV